MNILTTILESLYFFLPAYLANMSPVLFRKTFNFLARPVDGGRTFRGRRFLGDNKTWRGIIIGCIMAVILILIQRGLYRIPFFQAISLFDYQGASLPLLALAGFLFGFGALFGDSMKSFFKRQSGVPPGTSWFPFDQLDFAIGGLLFISVVFTPPLAIIGIILVLSPLLHVLVKFIGYLLRIDSKKI